MTNWQAVGILSIIAGIASCIGIIDGISIILTAPIGITSSIVAIRNGHKRLGMIGLILNIVAPIIFLGVLYGLFSLSPSR